MPVSQRCIDLALEAGEHDKQEQDFIIDRIKAMQADPAAREKLIAQAEEWSKAAAMEKTRMAATIKARQMADAHQEAAYESPGAKKAGIKEVTRSYAVGSQKEFTGGAQSIDYSMRINGIYHVSQAWGELQDIFGKTVMKLANDPDFNRLVAYELGGKDTGNQSAKQFMGVLRKYLDSGADAINAAGGHIEKLKDYIMNQSMALSPMKIARYVGDDFSKFSAFMKPYLKEETYSGQDPDEFLTNSLHNILQGGHMGDDSAEYKGAVGMIKRLSAHRVFQYKSPEAFLAVHEQFGKGTVINDVLHQIDKMHAQSTLLEKTGGNVDGFADYMVNKAKSKARETNQLFTPGDADAVRGDYRGLMGPSPVHSWTMNYYASIFREVLNSIHLGLSTFSSAGDVSNMAMNLKYSGMGVLESEGRAFSQFTKFWTFQNGRLDPKYRAIAKATGIGFQGAMHALAGRMNPLEDSGGAMARFMGSFFKWNRQAGWDDFFKQGTAEGLMNLIASHKDMKFDAIDPDMRMRLQQSGIQEKDWDIIRRSEVSTVDGSDFISADKIADKDVRLKYITHLFTHAEATVPLPGLREREAMGIMNFQRGTPYGEFMRLIMMYKAFPVSQMMKMWPRTVQMGLPGIGMAIPSYMMMGYLAMSMKNLVEGKLPPDPRDAVTYFESLAQSGGASMLADLLERKIGYGYSLADYVAGPAIHDVGQIIAPFSEAGHQRTLATAQSAGKQELETLGKMNPAANLWFTKAAYQYLITNEIQEAMNPGYLARVTAKQKQDYNVNYWLDPEKVHQELHK